MPHHNTSRHLPPLARHVKRLVMIALAHLALLATPAHADTPNLTIKLPGPHLRQSSIDTTGGFALQRFGISGWYVLPILHNGPIPGLNNSLDLEFGGLFGYFHNLEQPELTEYFAVIPALGCKWNFHLTHAWSVFAAAKVGYRIGLATPTHGFMPYGTLGARWRINDTIAMRFEAGYPNWLDIGVSIPL